ncbi:MOSC domain-containing protein [Pseudonocardia bannensis]|uniref:MOSC domain-containing protein n=1 Tax=Pseudonocardia bannensis TaxID=630973 RepID=A0A848DFC5_9PSEU|nr:MOSC domain-containing protein [Pseudonocardia bannensis]NMH91253.1 MOSC domain-containing protein [Pseudonocardia bannensis]
MDGGRVVSVNLATAGVQSVISRHGRSGIDKRPASGAVRLDVDGVEGDVIVDRKHHGGPEQAVYAYAVEDLAFWAAELERPMRPGQVGENLTVAGFDCSGAVIGERWRVGAAVLRVTAPRIPCATFASFAGVPDLVVRFMRARRPGCYLAVERPAAVRAGDPVRMLDRPAHGVTVADVLAAVGGRRELLGRVARARDDFGPRGREWLATAVTAAART